MNINIIYYKLSKTSSPLIKTIFQRIRLLAGVTNNISLFSINIISLNK